MDGQRLLYAGGPGKGKLDVIIYIKQERAFHVIDLEGGNSTLISEIVKDSKRFSFVRSLFICLSFFAGVYLDKELNMNTTSVA